jgi:hypothetical protein
MVALLWLLMPERAQAQVNTQQLDRGEFEGGWQAGASGDLSLRSGNVDLLEIAAAGSVRWQQVEEEDMGEGSGEPDANHAPWLRQRWRLDASLGYGREGGEDIINEQYAHTRWTAMWHRRVGSEAYLQAQRNEFQLLKLRALVGGGVRVDPIHGRRTALWFGTGAFYEHEDIDAAGDEGRQRTVRWSSYLAFRWTIGGRRDPALAVVLQNVAYAQPSFENLNDYRILDELQVDLPITAFVSFVTRFRVLYDTNPPPDVAQTDIRLSQGLAVTF